MRPPLIDFFEKPNFRDSEWPATDAVMADYLLFEAPMGYSLFKTVHKADTVGNRLKEVQESVLDLAKFGKMVELVSFLPFEYVIRC